MVFEGVLVQVLNRFLGDYVENLDHKQLSVGIWGGDVELKNLVLKQSALDDLDLPVQTVYGRIGKLVLKIPWKNLYGSAFVINVEDIYLLAQPNQQVKYDPAKEDKKQTESKKKEIQKVEEAKRQEAEKDKPKADYTFVEKLITQIIKNVQLNIKNIHIRYEDEVTNPLRPFALGVTLSDLDVVSTNENWIPAITQENISKIFKVVKLDGFAVYWNPNSTSYANTSSVDLIHKLSTEIASKDHKPSHYMYILGPINASARLRINQKPELDSPAYTIPKVHLNLDMERLFVGISKAQYQDIIALADSMDRMSKGTEYRKYRPAVTGYKGNYAEWWKFAYTCVLEGQVRRRKRNWDWAHILSHRSLCKEYGELYQKKLRNQAKGDEKARIEECEKNLDIFNIVIIRQRIELETERLERVQSKAEKKGWFGWMWGSNAAQEQSDINSSTDLLKQFEDAMTSEEKARLYKAIDYQDNASPAQYPEGFVDNSCTFLLRTLEIELRDDENAVKRLMFTELKGVKCRVDTRAAASALMVHVKIDEFATFGLAQDQFIPRMIKSEVGGNESGLLEVTFETNPIDKTCGQRLHVTAQPLKIVYDAQTIIKIIDVFKVPPSSSLEQLSAAAGSGLTNIKEMSSTGLQHAIDQHVRLDLKIDLHAPYIIIPYGGKYTDNENENVLVVNLGNVKIYSVDRSSANVKKMHADGLDESEILKEMIAQSYDQFRLELTHLQVLVAQSSEDWRSCITQTKTTEMHLLNPVNLNVTFYKCLITDDPRLPLAKVNAELPSLDVSVSDARLLLLVALGTSIPLPGGDVPESKPLEKGPHRNSSKMMLKYLEMQESAQKTKDLLPKQGQKSDSLVQFTTVDVKFVMSEFSLKVRTQESVEAPSKDLASFKIKSLECDLVQQTYNTKVSLRLASVGLQQYRNDGQQIDIVTTPGLAENGRYLFDVKFVQVDKKSPDFHTVHKSCEAFLRLEFARLEFTLHKEGLLDLMRFSAALQAEVEEAMSAKSGTTLDRVASTSSGEGPLRRLSVISENLKFGEVNQRGKRARRNVQAVVETVKFKLAARLQEFTVKFATDAAQICACAIKGIHSEVILKTAHTQINAKLDELTVIDLNPKTIHNLILSGTSEKTLDARVVLYNLEKNETEKSDMSVELTMGGVRIIFLNWFVTRMLDFLNEFQTAQAKIIEASQAAAQSAKQNMQDVYAKATKISLSIDLKAPVIIVPVDSHSYDALMLDMGYISLSNRFITLDVKNEEGFSAVIDELKMSLKKFNLARIKLDNRYAVLNESKLLEPMSFRFSIKRNLSNSWYKAVPDVDISGKIETIMLLLSQADYQMVMDVVGKNLSEGQTHKVAPPQLERQKSDQGHTLAVIESKRSIISGTDPNMSKSDLDPVVHTVLRFTFTMDKLGVSLFSGGSKVLSGDSPTHDERLGLGRFSLEGLSVKARMLTDNSLVTSVLLVNCVLEDMRKGRENRLNRLIERSVDANESIDATQGSSESVSNARSMIDVTFQMKNQDMFADVRVYSFTMILSVDYLMKIAEFFTGGGDANNTNKPKIAAKPSAHAKTNKSNVTVVAPKEAQMTINLKIEKPDIILVEHMDNIDTKALILNSEIVLKLRTAGPHQVINGSIKDLQLYTCAYNPAKRAETRSNVLHPVTISLAGSTPEDKGLHMELIITDIRLSVSPPTIELLNRVSVTVTGGGPKEGGDDTELQNFSNIWDYKPYSDQDHWFLRAEDAYDALDVLQTPPGSDGDTLPTQRPLQELCIVSMPSVVLTIEAGVGNKTLPMLMLESSFKGNLRNWSSQLSVDAGLTLEMGYYNSRLALWEPLIEPVEVTRNNRRVFVPWELKLEVSMNEQEDILSPGSDGVESDLAPLNVQPVMSIDVISENNLELTVTKTCLDVLNNLGKAFANAIKSEEIKADVSSSPYKVVNELGTSVTIALERGSFKIDGRDETIDVILESGTEVALQLKPSLAGHVSLRLGRELVSDNASVKDHFLNVKVNDRNCNLDLPVVRADKRFFPLNYRGEGNDNWGLISDVKVDEGVTVITLRSILQVYNHFNRPIEVYYMTVKGNELASLTAVQPGACVDIPLNAVYTPTNELFFGVEGYSVTTTPYIWKNLQTNLSVTKSLQCEPKNVQNGNEPFIIKAVGEMEQIYFENTSRHTMSSTCYNIHLRPTVAFMNCLPIEVVCCLENVLGETTVQPGGDLILPNVDPGKSCVVIRLPSYLEKEWSCRQEVLENSEEFTVWTFYSYDSSVKMALDLGMHVVNDNGTMTMTLYCPFWMLNKTGLTLSYRKSKKTEKNEASGSPAKVAYSA